ncbi:MAG: L,D-transpeptidase [Deltaproteobacteria bacterium]|nr:L,D-transpeptidase [Deltaproteobacteria bacterium]
MRVRIWGCLAILVLVGCDSRRSPRLGVSEARASTRAKRPPPAPPPPAQEEELLDPEEPVHVFENGRKVRTIEHVQALREGYTVVDLSNDWAPYILGDCQAGGQCFRNDYRPTFVALANRRPLPEGAIDPEGPYLELFGINPTLSLIKSRIAEDAEKPCIERLTYDALREFDGLLAYQPGTDSSWIRTQAQSTGYGATRVAKKLGLSGPDELRGVRGQERIYERYHEADVRHRALLEAQDRAICEGLVPRGLKLRRGVFDLPTHLALAQFERKNRVFGWGFVGRDTIVPLRRSPEEGHYQTFVRMLEERVADGARVLEDGSVRQIRGAPTTFRTLDGKTEPLRNLVEEYRDVVLAQMGLDTREKFFTWLAARADEELEKFKIAVKLPPRPSYYGPAMELSVEVDRGDVWYDFPWDDEGNPIPQPVVRRPHLTLYTTYNGQKIPIVYFGTTIGGWRSEHVDGEEYYAYKNSDVGERVWRQILAAPIWIPPDTTPVSGLVTKPRANGRRFVNYQEFGPGYASAYGLVAAFNQQPATRPDGTTVYFDWGIRTHGSHDYMSIMQRHSHGCHRLYNHLAIRLFDYVLRHRVHTVEGQTRVEYGRTFEFEDRPYRLELHSRGYQFLLDPPVPVNVLPGRIMGRVKRPIEEPIRKPGVVYRADTAATVDPVTGLPIPAPTPAGDTEGAQESIAPEPVTTPEVTPAY